MADWVGFADPIYGKIRLADDVHTLAQKAVLQRLRHVRLSNIDSVDIPSIANLSRFEHVLGVGHLAGLIGLRSRLNKHDLLVLDASALLHDWAITSFGHLVEEGLQYVGTGFDHEKRLRDIVLGKSDELLGTELQIFAGRSAGISEWARDLVGHDHLSLLKDIMAHIGGAGALGKVIAGDIDIDNIDNVVRMAYHIGLNVDKDLAARLSAAIVDIETNSGEPIFKRSAEIDIQTWRAVRRQVYENLMLAQRDFVGKAMILSCTVRAYQAREITIDDWKMVDHEFVCRLKSSRIREIRETIDGWLAGELWACTHLVWMRGRRPNYPEMLEYSSKLSDDLHRYCFSYGIKDKRERVIKAHFDNGHKEVYGVESDRWLLGTTSSTRRPFSAKENRMMLDAACAQFGTEVIGPAQGEQAWLL